MAAKTPFEIHIPQSTLQDLQDRLNRTRWTSEPEDSGWGMGTSLGYLKDLVDYWQQRSRINQSMSRKLRHTRTQLKLNTNTLGIFFIINWSRFCRRATHQNVSCLSTPADQDIPTSIRARHITTSILSPGMPDCLHIRRIGRSILVCKAHAARLS